MGYDDDGYYNANENDASNDDVGDDGETESGDFWESEEGINKYFVVYLTLLSLVLVLSKFLHDSPKVGAILPEAGMIILVGTVAGAIIFMSTPLSDRDDQEDDDSIFNGSVNKFVAEGLLSFSPTIFFFVLLPPIIFNSGYTLKPDLFFRHIAPISLFACAGTLISTFVVAIFLHILKKIGLTGGFQPRFSELLTFGSLISATDPVSTLAVFQAKKVDPQLFYLVFGESVLNDAVGLVLFKTFSKFVGNQDSFDEILNTIVEFLVDFLVGFIGSMIAGFGVGLSSAYFLKKVDMRHTPVLELSLFFLIMYMPFFLGELLELSGIVTILFTGIFARRYATENLSESTEQNVETLFRIAAHIAETSIFLELGLSVFGQSASLNWQFVSWSILACLVGRALNIYPLRRVYNGLLLNRGVESNLSERSIKQTESILSMTPNAKKDLKVRNNTAHMLWFSGLRGAVAYSCAKTFPNIYGNRPVFVSTTMAIVFFTVFIFGCTTECALNYLEIEVNCDEEKYMKDNKTVDKMHFVNIFENKYIVPYVIRQNSQKNNGAIVEMNNMSAVTDAKSWVNPVGSPGSKFTNFQNYEDTDTEWAGSYKKRNSLYDYGMGTSSVISFRSDRTDSILSGGAVINM